MVFDWQNNREEALANGIRECRVFSTKLITMTASNNVVAHHTFRNFSKLAFEEGTLIEDCIFENCADITIDGCRVDNCTFRCVDLISFIYSNVTNSRFCDLTGGNVNDAVLLLEDGELNHCTFENITLQNDSFLCSGSGSPWIEHCDFSKIRTSRADREIILCEEEVGMIFKHTKQFCIVDENSCTGLDQIEYLPEQELF